MVHKSKKEQGSNWKIEWVGGKVRHQLPVGSYFLYERIVATPERIRMDRIHRLPVHTARIATIGRWMGSCCSYSAHVTGSRLNCHEELPYSSITASKMLRHTNSSRCNRDQKGRKKHNTRQHNKASFGRKKCSEWSSSTPRCHLKEDPNPGRKSTC